MDEIRVKLDYSQSNVMRFKCIKNLIFSFRIESTEQIFSFAWTLIKTYLLLWLFRFAIFIFNHNLSFFFGLGLISLINLIEVFFLLFSFQITFIFIVILIIILLQFLWILYVYLMIVIVFSLLATCEVEYISKYAFILIQCLLV